MSPTKNPRKKKRESQREREEVEVGFVFVFFYVSMYIKIQSGDNGGGRRRGKSTTCAPHAPPLKRYYTLRLVAVYLSTCTTVDSTDFSLLRSQPSNVTVTKIYLKGTIFIELRRKKERMKIVTYNVNGLRQRVSQFDSLLKLLHSFDADIICFQVLLHFNVHSIFLRKFQSFFRFRR